MMNFVQAQKQKSSFFSFRHGHLFTKRDWPVALRYIVAQQKMSKVFDDVLNFKNTTRIQNMFLATEH